jgi:hypothetical protein
MKSRYFDENLATFIANRCVFSILFNHILIRCKSKEDFIFLVEQRKDIFCQWVTIWQEDKGLKASFRVKD